jgi:putative acetyltransferase
MNDISIRTEAASDFGAVRDLICKVFHETYGTGDVEATLVEKLREQPENGPNVSLVAELDGAIVGHVFFSGIKLVAHPDIPVCCLAPLGVYSQYQKKGVGSQLTRKGLAECADRGYKAVFVQGDLNYYPRFGFIPIGKTDLHTVFESDHDMIMELEQGILDNVSGLADFPKPWDALK